MEGKKERFYQLDALKFFAAILIVLYHYQQITGARFSGINFYGGRFQFEYLVEFFFLLSGFFMSFQVKRNSDKSFQEFIWPRIRRLYPAAMISVAVYCIGAWIYRWLTGGWWFDTPVGLWKLFTSLFLIQAGGAVSIGYGANNPIWYLSVLMICYIIYWCILWLSKRLHMNPYVVFAGMIFVGLSVLSYDICLPYLNGDSARGYVGFFFGLVFGKWHQNTKNQKRSVWIAIAILVGCFAAALANYVELYDNFSMIMVFLVYPSIVVLSVDTGIAKKLFGGAFWGILGGISYEIYLWHVPLLLIIANVKVLLGYTSEYTYLSMLGFAGVVFVVAAIMYSYVEHPPNRDR